MIDLDFSRCRSVWVPDDSEAGGFWNPVFEHVKVAVRKIVECPYLLLADDMGLSKTASAIIAAQFLHELDVIDRMIVVAPASIRPKVWFDEDLGQLKEQLWNDKRVLVTEYHSRARQWRHGPQEGRELRIIVTNYEFIRDETNLTPLYPYCGPRTFLVLDESSAVRGWSSAQTAACMKLRWRTKRARGGHEIPLLGVPRCGRILQLNGTPLAESPMDLFSLGNLLHPSILNCQYITHYKARYAVQVPVIRYDGTPLLNKWNRPVLTIQPGMQGWTNLDDLQRRFAPYVLRREAKDLGINFALPPVALEVQLTKKTWRVYKDMRDEMVVWLKSGIATAQTAAVRAIRLSQITSGFVGGVERKEDLLPDDVESSFVTNTIDDLGDGEGAVREIGREKLDFSLEWHAELLRRYPDLKLVSWCRFVPELRRYLTEVKQTFNHPVAAACGASVLGESVKAEREAALRLLHPKTAPEGPVTVGATQGTGALGLNFTACRTVLDISYDFSPWKKKQSDSRFNRPGQTGMVSFFYLIAVGPNGQKTIDHHVMLTRLGKMNVNAFTVSAWVKMLTEE